MSTPSTTPATKIGILADVYKLEERIALGSWSISDVYISSDKYLDEHAHDEYEGKVYSLDEVVVAQPKLFISYSDMLGSSPLLIAYNAPNSKGFTRRDILHIIAKQYGRIAADIIAKKSPDITSDSKVMEEKIVEKLSTFQVHGLWWERIRQTTKRPFAGNEDATSTNGPAIIDYYPDEGDGGGDIIVAYNADGTPAWKPQSEAVHHISSDT